MKQNPPKLRSLPLLGLAMSLLFPLTVMAEINSVFSEPPFQKDRTIVGIEGWEMQNKEPHPVYTDPAAATVVDSPVANPTQPQTLELQTLVKNDRLADIGEQFVVEAQFAVTFNPIYAFNGGLYFRFERTEAATPFHFGFYHGEGGGLYFQGQGEPVILLPKQEIIQGAAYKFLIHVNRETFRFRVTVTCQSDESFLYESKETPFQDEALLTRAKFPELFVGNNKPSTVKAYIDYVKIGRAPQ